MVSLVDWDDVVLAPPERDFMFLRGGVSAALPVTAEQEAWFMQGYGPVELDPARLAYHQCARALEDLAGPAAQVLDAGSWSLAERQAALAVARGVMSPTGLVRRAVRAARAVETASSSMRPRSSSAPGPVSHPSAQNARGARGPRRTDAARAARQQSWGLSALAPRCPMWWGSLMVAPCGGAVPRLPHVVGQPGVQKGRAADQA